MDFVLGLLRTPRGFDSIFTVVDRLRKMAYFMSCHIVDDTSNINRLFFRDMVKLHGIPHTIVSNRDTKFLNYFWKTLWSRLGTKLNFSISCHPQTNRKTEVVNRSFSTILRRILKGNHKSWDEYLPHIKFAYNRVVHRTTRTSPFEVVCGFNPLTPVDMLPLSTSFDFIHKEEVAKSYFIKKMHERVRRQI